MVLRVLVAEDNLLVREGVVKLLNACAETEVIGACSTYDELLAAGAAYARLHQTQFHDEAEFADEPA